MKIIDDSMKAGVINGFGFSGVRPDRLGATEYTLVTLVTDVSGSVQAFAGELLKMKQAIVQSCRKSPRADYLMLRDIEFANSVTEVTGFKELRSIDESAFPALSPRGSTALFDALFSTVAATNEYAKELSAADFNANAIIFVVTDGEDNASLNTPAMVKREMERGVKAEWLESINVVLVGVNAQACAGYLDAVKRDAGLTQFVDAGSATPQKLAKLADFVSRSVSSQSQSLGTGGASQPLTF